MPRLDDLRHRTPPPAHDTMGTASIGTIAAGIVFAVGLLALIGKLAERDERVVAAEAAQAQADRTYGANLVIPLADCPAGTGPLLLIIERDAHGRPVTHDCRVVISRGQAARGWTGKSRESM